MNYIKCHNKLSGFSREQTKILSNEKERGLNIGFGLNLSHYPEYTKEIAALNINPGMNDGAQERTLETGISVECRCLNSELLSFETEYFYSAISEIHSVLKSKS